MVDQWRDENVPSGDYHRGSIWNTALKGLNPDGPDFFNSFSVLNLKSHTGRQLINLDMPYDVCDVSLDPVINR